MKSSTFCHNGNTIGLDHCGVAGLLLQGKAVAQAFPSLDAVWGKAQVISQKSSSMNGRTAAATLILQLLQAWRRHFRSNAVRLAEDTVTAVKQCEPCGSHRASAVCSRVQGECHDVPNARCDKKRET